MTVIKRLSCYSEQNLCFFVATSEKKTFTQDTKPSTLTNNVLPVIVL